MEESVTQEQLQALEAERVCLFYRTGIKLDWKQTVKAAQKERFLTPAQLLKKQRGETNDFNSRRR